METQDFRTSIIVSQTPHDVFDAVNDPRAWWSEEIVGETDKLNSIWNYHYKDVHICKIKIVELVPDKKVVWEVLENHFSFVTDQSEWVGTKIEFAISQKEGKTELIFTHHGLTPKDECFQICNDAWTQYIENSLRNLIVAGKGQPNPKEGGFNEYLAGKAAKK
ncbi:MAG: SRPBCC domain-containing protein [Flavobacterium sp.]|nr:SRPBCC domain-containing protein [Flavobacterium sp.]RZJ67248.1 MAG: SRPBCC domain-containing protein [Flavobacterium sp.]